MKEYYLRDIDGLKAFINDLLSRNSKNNKRVEKIKKLLLTEPLPPGRDSRIEH
jgi:hypothetical protein